MDNKKNKIMTMVFIVSILILVVSTTYAFFAPQNGGTTSSNATVTSNTTDLLTFSINRDISFTVTQALFAENGENQSGDATATATLTPNNKTGAATMNYYLYLNLQNNPTVYSSTNTNEDPELMLQVFDGNNQLVTLTGLGTQKTIKGVTGYDITGVTGLKTLLDNHAISASNNTATIENWRIVITLINLDVNQNDNTGKTISAEIIISKEEFVLPSPYLYWNNGFDQDFFASSDEVPNGNNLMGTYNSREALANAVDYEYNNSNFDYSFSTIPFYIKSRVENDNVLGHEVCVWHNNAELCLEPNYWIGDAQDDIDGTSTLNKLLDDISNNLNISLNSSDCTYDAFRDQVYGHALCSIGNITCGAHSDGSAICSFETWYCYVDGDGASCHNENK